MWLQFISFLGYFSQYSNGTEGVVLYSGLRGTLAETPFLISFNHPYAFKPNEARHKTQQREADKITVVLFPLQVRRHLSESSVLVCAALLLCTEYTRQSGNFGPCQEVGVYFVMTSRLLAQVHQLDVSVCQSFRDSRIEREVRLCAVIMG